MVVRWFARSLRRSLALVVGCAVVATGATYAWDQRDPAQYESVTRVILAPVAGTEAGADGDTASAGAEGPGVAPGVAASYVEVATSQLLASRVAARVSDEHGVERSIADLVDHVAASAPGDGSVLELRVRDTDASLAQEIAQAYTEELAAVAGEIGSDGTVEAARVAVTVLDFPSFPADPVTPRLLRDLLLALGAGVLLGLLVALVVGALDRTIRSRRDLVRVVTVPVLATIAHESAGSRKRLISEIPHGAARVEAFRTLRTNVQFLHGDVGHQVVAVTSSVEDEGKSSVAVDLAITLARAGLRVLLVDGDLRRPALDVVFNTDGVVGLTTVLLGKIDLAEATWRHEPSGLEVLFSGVTPPNAPDLLQTHAAAALFDRMRLTYDVVVVDSAPLLPVTDAALLAGRADSTLLVVRHGVTRRDRVVAALDRLSQVDVVPAGVVLNDAPRRRRADDDHLVAPASVG